MKRFTLVVGVAGTLALSQTAGAVDFFPYLSAGVTFSDNVDRGRVRSVDDAATLATAGFGLYADTLRVLADVEASITHQDYVKDSFSSTTLPHVAASVYANLIPERLAWTFDDDLGQIANSPFGALEPADRQDTNVFTTGPDLMVPLGETNQLTFSGRFSDVTFSESDIDNERYGGEVELRHDISALKSIALAYTSTSVRFDRDDLYRNYDVEDVVLRYNTEARRTTGTISVGVTTLDDGTDRDSGLSFGVTLYRQLGAYTIIGIDYREGFSDTADSFRFGQRGTLGGTDQNVIVRADPFEQRRGTIEARVEKSKWFVRMSAFISDEDYTTELTTDRKVKGADFGTGWRSSARTLWVARGRYEEDRLIPDGEHNEGWLFGVDMERQLGTALRFEMGVERYRRLSNIEVDFWETRVNARLTYEPGALRRTQRREFFPTRRVPLPGRRDESAREQIPGQRPQAPAPRRP